MTPIGSVARAIRGRREHARRGLAVVAIAFLVLVAGCSGISGLGPTETTVREHTTTSATPTTTEDDFPPGLTPAGVTDAWALAAAHAETIRAATFSKQAVVVRRVDGTVQYRSDWRFSRVDDGRYQSVLDYQDGASGPTRHSEAFADGTFVYTMSGAAGRTNARRSRGTDGDSDDPRGYHRSNGTDRGRLYDLFSSFDVTVADEHGGYGAKRYVLESTRVTRPGMLASMWNLDSIGNASLRAVVGPDGVVHEFRVEYDGTSDDSHVSGYQQVQFTGVGSTDLDPPAWVQDLRNRSASADGDRDPAAVVRD